MWVAAASSVLQEAIDRDAVLLRPQRERRRRIYGRAALLHSACAVNDDMGHPESVHQLQGRIRRERLHGLRLGVKVSRGKTTIAVDQRVAVSSGVDQILRVSKKRPAIVEGQLDDNRVRLVAETIINGGNSREFAIPQRRAQRFDT